MSAGLSQVASTGCTPSSMAAPDFERARALSQPAGDRRVVGAVDLPGEEEPAADVLTQDEQVRPTAALDDPGDDAGRLILELDAEPVR